MGGFQGFPNFFRQPLSAGSFLKALRLARKFSPWVREQRGEKIQERPPAKRAAMATTIREGFWVPKNKQLQHVSPSALLQ